jgi:hypothetical protein
LDHHTETVSNDSREILTLKIEKLYQVTMTTLTYTRERVLRMPYRCPAGDYSTPERARRSRFYERLAFLTHLSRFNVATEEELQELQQLRAVQREGY